MDGGFDDVLPIVVSVLIYVLVDDDVIGLWWDVEG